MNADWQCMVDAGNSRVKRGWFRQGQLEGVEVLSLAEWQSPLPQKAALVRLASVSLAEHEMADWFRAQGVSRVEVFDAQSQLPFASNYGTRHTLGSDRKLLIAGANARFPSINRLVVGLGTCITFDLVDQTGKHLGGDISPGMHMRWQAMHQQTARLPLVEMPATWPILGSDTISALQAGVLQGLLAEIKGRKAQLELILDDLTIILSGGDAHFFENRFDSPIFAEPNLALYGLHALT